jgi:uncharacterized membrane protein
MASKFKKNYLIRAYTVISMLLINPARSIICFLCGMLRLLVISDRILSAINEIQQYISSNVFSLLLADE